MKKNYIIPQVEEMPMGPKSILMTSFDPTDPPAPARLTGDIIP